MTSNGGSVTRNVAPAPYIVLRVNATTMRFHDGTGDGESQVHAMGFRRIERIQQVLKPLHRIPAPASTIWNSISPCRVVIHSRPMGELASSAASTASTASMAFMIRLMSICQGACGRHTEIRVPHNASEPPDSRLRASAPVRRRHLPSRCRRRAFELQLALPHQLANMTDGIARAQAVAADVDKDCLIHSRVDSHFKQDFTCIRVARYRAQGLVESVGDRRSEFADDRQSRRERKFLSLPLWHGVLVRRSSVSSYAIMATTNRNA